MVRKLTLVAAVCLLAAACAKENTMTSGEKAKAYLDMYMEKYHPGLKPNGDGIYILEDTPGTGKAWSEDSTYTYARSTIRTLTGTISSTSEEKVAQQLGTYVKGYYYGPKFSVIGSGSSYAGVDAMLKGMRFGGTRKVIIPSWLLTTNRYDTLEEYIKACSSETHMEYTVSLEWQTDSIQRTEIDSLERYVRLMTGKSRADSDIFADGVKAGTFYFFTDSSAFKGKDHFKADTTMNINYTGFLLNGQVFDTTIEKVAKDGGIYNSSKSYEPVSVTFASDYSKITMGSSSLITGFQVGLNKMHWVGQKATVYFTSDYGYSSGGGGDAIPPYSPLRFEIEIVKE